MPLRARPPTRARETATGCPSGLERATAPSNRLAHAAPIVGVTLLGLVLRFATLDVQSFSSDETVTALLVRLDFGSMLGAIEKTESTPPLYYVVAWLWTHVFGRGEVGLRSLSALLGTAAIPLTYSAGVKLVSRRTGIGAAAIVAVSPLLVEYSQDARAYALLVALSAASLALFAHVRERPTGRALVGWSVASSLALASHYFAVFAVVAEALWLLVIHRRRDVRIAVGSAALAGLVLLPLALEQRANPLAGYLTAGDPLRTRIAILGKQFLVGGHLPHDRFAALLVGLVVVLSAVAFLARGNRVARRGAACAAVVGASSIVVPVGLAALGHDYVITRNAIGGLIPLVVAGCAGVDALTRRVASIGVAVVSACLAAISLTVAFEPKYQTPDWRGLATSVRAPSEARLLVVAPNLDGWSARIPLRVYLPSAIPVGRELLRSAPQLLPLVGRASELAAPHRVVTREVDLIGVQWPLPSRPAGLPTSFHLVAQSTTDRLRTAVYRARRPVAIDVTQLDVQPGAAAIVFQTAG